MKGDRIRLLAAIVNRVILRLCQYLMIHHFRKKNYILC